MKAYYWDQVLVWNQESWVKKDLLFGQERFYPPSFKHHFTIREITSSHFFLTPGKVYTDLEFPFSDQKKRFMHARRYLYRGASLVIAIYPLPVEKNIWKWHFQQYIQALSDIPIDYTVVPKINIKFLTQEMIRFFSLQKIPFIAVWADSEEDLPEKWEWLYQEQKLFRIPFAVFQDESQDMLKAFLKDCQFLLLSDDLSFFPLSRSSLIQTGIAPRKGDLNPNGLTDFNLYEMKYKHIETDSDKVFFHKISPFITIMRGNMIKLKQTVDDRKGAGQFFKISLPQHFQL